MAPGGMCSHVELGMVGGLHLATSPVLYGAECGIPKANLSRNLFYLLTLPYSARE